MSFNFSGELTINDETVISDTEKIYTCDSLTAEILQSVTSSWSSFRVYNCEMNAASLNPFYYCMANSAHRASDGYTEYYFESPLYQYGLFDPAVLTALATASEGNLEFYYINGMTALSADE